jgi:hypothetical protein
MSRVKDVFRKMALLALNRFVDASVRRFGIEPKYNIAMRKNGGVWHTVDRIKPRSSPRNGVVLTTWNRVRTSERQPGRLWSKETA